MQALQDHFGTEEDEESSDGGDGNGDRQMRQVDF